LRGNVWEIRSQASCPLFPRGYWTKRPVGSADDHGAASGNLQAPSPVSVAKASSPFEERKQRFTVRADRKVKPRSANADCHRGSAYRVSLFVAHAGDESKRPAHSSHAHPCCGGVVLEHEAVDHQLRVGPDDESGLISKHELSFADGPRLDAIAHVDGGFELKNARARRARCCGGLDDGYRSSAWFNRMARRSLKRRQRQEQRSRYAESTPPRQARTSHLSWRTQPTETLPQMRTIGSHLRPPAFCYLWLRGPVWCVYCRPRPPGWRRLARRASGDSIKPIGEPPLEA
jgi:hypothetical protein